VIKTIRYPKSIEEALQDCIESLGDDTIAVTPTKELFIDMLTVLAKVKHS
jgi:hypothetical protein